MKVCPIPVNDLILNRPTGPCSDQGDSKIKILGLVQRFYNVYLLPRIRDEIEFYKKLNFHMMQCLKKALYKPAAFFKGILIPLERISKMHIGTKLL